MSEAVDQKAVELMDRAANAVEAFAGKLGNLSEQYGPEVADAALAVARVEAGNALLGQVVGLAGIFLIAVLAVKGIRAAWRCDDARRDPEVKPIFLCLVGIPSTGAVLVLWFTVVGTIWPVIGLIEPKLWIAKQVLGL